MAEWTTLPVSAGDEPDIGNHNEIRTAIEKRRALIKATSSTIWNQASPPAAKVEGDELGGIGKLQGAVEALVGTGRFYIRSGGNFYQLTTSATPSATQKNIWTEALGGGRTDWRSDTEPPCELNIHTPNDLKSCLEILTIVRIGISADISDHQTETYCDAMTYADVIWADCRADAFNHIDDNNGSFFGQVLGRRGKGYCPQTGGTPYYCEASFVEGGKVVADTSEWDLTDVTRVTGWLRFGTDSSSADDSASMPFEIKIGAVENGSGSIPYSSTNQAIEISFTDLNLLNSGSDTDIRFYYDANEKTDPTAFTTPTDYQNPRWYLEGCDDLGADYMPSGVAPAGVYLEASF